MLGWEFPPVFSGGLGIVTQNITLGLRELEVDLTLLLPQFILDQVSVSDDARVKNLIRGSFLETKIHVEKIETINVPTSINSPYTNEYQYSQRIHAWSESLFVNRKTPSPSSKKKGSIYGKTLFEEVDRFAQETLLRTKGEHFDVIHAHDWITAEAGLQLKWEKKIPLILHIHATEVDRTGNMTPSGEVFRREKYAMENADKIITVSYYTKSILVEVYGISPEKIEVVHNVYTKEKKHLPQEQDALWKKDKSQFWVLFIGRVTLQKGPDYFIDVARKVIPLNPNIHFLVAGDGDMMGHIIEQAAKYDIAENVHFLGFLTNTERDALYRFTDCCIMPSVSEPFGLTAIEVASYRTPLIVSKNCGANEVITHKLPVDFWDTEKMSEYVLALQKYPIIRRFIRNQTKDSLSKETWTDKCREIQKIYEQVIEKCSCLK